jgi:tRNA pseudouridine38-40 synthase
MRYRFIVAYDGTDFHGWQKQQARNGDQLRTVQDVLEKAIIKVLREPVKVAGASRTDSGVHARGQVAACTSSKVIEPERLLCAVNSHLPSDVQVGSVDIVHDSFDPITDCTSKGYRYMIAHGCRDPRRTPLFDRHFVTHTSHELMIEPMQQAAKLLEGEHNFAAFTRLNHGRETTVRRVDSCTVQATSDWRAAIDISGNGFLWNMVRIIAGTLLEVGRGKILPDEIPDILSSGDRRRTGKTMPPEGLCLEWVQYNDR